jgi:hypothetical protein
MAEDCPTCPDKQRAVADSHARAMGLSPMERMSDVYVGPYTPPTEAELAEIARFEAPPDRVQVRPADVVLEPPRLEDPAPTPLPQRTPPAEPMPLPQPTPPAQPQSIPPASDNPFLHQPIQPIDTSTPPPGIRHSQDPTVEYLPPMNCAPWGGGVATPAGVGSHAEAADNWQHDLLVSRQSIRLLNSWRLEILGENWWERLGFRVREVLEDLHRLYDGFVFGPFEAPERSEGGRCILYYVDHTVAVRPRRWKSAGQRDWEYEDPSESGAEDLVDRSRSDATNDSARETELEIALSGGLSRRTFLDALGNRAPSHVSPIPDVPGFRLPNNDLDRYVVRGYFCRGACDDGTACTPHDVTPDRILPGFEEPAGAMDGIVCKCPDEAR